MGFLWYEIRGLQCQKSVIRSILCGLFMREESVGIMEVGILIVLLSPNEGGG